MTGRARLTSILAGAAAGLSGGLFGVGGGVVLIPLLTGFLGLTQHRAHGTSLAIVVITAIAAVTVYAVHGNVAWLTGALLMASSVVTAPWGARLGKRLTGPALARVFAVFLLVVAVRLLWRPPAAAPALLTGWAGVLVDLVIGAAAGVLAGFMGVGGGLLMVPAMTLLLGMPQQLAQGTSLVAIVGSGTSGALAHRRQGTLALELVPWLGLGAVIGGPLASWWVQGLPRDVLTRGFAVFMLAMSVVTWLRARPASATTPGPVTRG